MQRLTPLQYIDEVAKAGSIRKAAEILAITPSALNRRVLAVEAELGVAIFERMARGVRLSTAGEILVHHIRRQVADIERVRSQIADLSGVRRGHVSIACSQALLRHFLPRQIESYRQAHPAVTFSVYVRDGPAAEKALSDHTADLALIFEPERFVDFQTITTADQPVRAVMRNGHPLADQSRIRLRDCLQYPLAVPLAPSGVRALLEAVAVHTKARFEPVLQSDNLDLLTGYASIGDTIAFQAAIGLPPAGEFDDRVSRPIDSRDLQPSVLHMGQLRDRILPVAAARFADQLATAFAEDFDGP